MTETFRQLLDRGETIVGGGHLGGKQVIDRHRFPSLITAVVEARSSDEFIIVARTDAAPVNLLAHFGADAWNPIRDRFATDHTPAASSTPMRTAP